MGMVFATTIREVQDSGYKTIFLSTIIFF